MDEFRVSGVVISSIDYKEKDKLITIYSLQLGKITATLKGVKNKNAKLKFASQLFCFAEFILAKKGEYFTVISAEQIESFYDITADYDRYLIGQSLCEVINIVMQPGLINEKFFIFVLKCLKLLSYSDVHENIILVKFFLSLFSFAGYEVNFNYCAECDSFLNSEIFFNVQSGFVTCKNCAGGFAIALTKQNYAYLKLINNADIDNLETVKIKGPDLKLNISVLTKNFAERFGKPVKILKEFFLN